MDSRIVLGLNPRKVGNYAFFCPDSRLHLTMGNPTGSVGRITSPILRGLKTKVLIDVNGVVNLETGEVNNVVTLEVNQVVEAPEKPIVESEESTKPQEEIPVEVKSSKKGKRAEAKPVDEAAAQSEKE